MLVWTSTSLRRRAALKSANGTGRRKMAEIHHAFLEATWPRGNSIWFEAVKEGANHRKVENTKAATRADAHHGKWVSPTSR